MLKTLSILTLLAAAPSADVVSGTWQIEGDVVGNSLSQVCTFQQKEAALTGSCTPTGGVATAIKGEVKDGKVTFRYDSQYEGEPITVIYTGTLTADELIQGTVFVQPFEVNGVFTAKRAPAKP